jgi:solute carrier family 25, member 42
MRPAENGVSNLSATSTNDKSKTSDHPRDVAVSLLCGGISGAVAKTAVAPVERVKMSFQISPRLFSLSRAFQHGQDIVRGGGLSSLWKGHSTTIIRVAPLAGISFAAHDYTEVELKEYLKTDRLPIMYKFLAGAVAGATGTFVTYPLDVMRVRLALTPGSNWVTTFRQGGLYQGLTPTMLGIIPYAGTAWMIKQTLLEKFENIQRRSPSLIESLVVNAIAG